MVKVGNLTMLKNSLEDRELVRFLSESVLYTVKYIQRGIFKNDSYSMQQLYQLYQVSVYVFREDWQVVKKTYAGCNTARRVKMAPEVCNFISVCNVFVTSSYSIFSLQVFLVYVCTCS